MLAGAYQQFVQLVLDHVIDLQKLLVVFLSYRSLSISTPSRSRSLSVCTSPIKVSILSSVEERIEELKKVQEDMPEYQAAQQRGKLAMWTSIWRKRAGTTSAAGIIDDQGIVHTGPKSAIKLLAE